MCTHVVSGSLVRAAPVVPGAPRLKGRQVSLLVQSESPALFPRLYESLTQVPELRYLLPFL